MGVTEHKVRLAAMVSGGYDHGSLLSVLIP